MGRRVRLTKGFTLGELIVAISIVFVLSALAFPVFAKAKDSALDVVAIQNAKQIGLANLIYVQDNDDSFPLHTTFDGRTVLAWQELVKPYLGNDDKIFFHPKAPKVAQDDPYRAVKSWQSWGVLPRMSTIGWVPPGGTVTISVNGRRATVDGVYGAGIGASFRSLRTAPSVQQSQIQNLDSVIMVIEAGAWDLGFSMMNSAKDFPACGRQPGPLHAYSGPVCYGIPFARKNSSGTWRGGEHCEKGVTIGGTSTFVSTGGSSRQAMYFRDVFATADSDAGRVLLHWWTGNTSE